MKEKTRAWWVGMAVVAALVAVVVLTGWGLFLTITQSREIEQVIAHAATLDAERRLQDIDAGLIRFEGDMLGRLAELLRDDTGTAPRDMPSLPQRVEALQERFPLLTSPFILDSELEFLHPPIRLTEEDATSPLLSDEPPPEDVTTAMRLLWSEAPAAESRRALESLYHAPELATSWRLRAIAAIASLEMSNGTPELAASSYEKLFREFSKELDNRLTQPSKLHLILARVRALRECRREGEARRLLAEAMLGLIEGRLVASSPEEERFFVKEVSRWCDEESSPFAEDTIPVDNSPRTLGQLVEAHRQKFGIHRETEPMRGWGSIPVRIAMERSRDNVGEGPHRFIDRRSATKRLIVWNEVPTHAAGIGSPVVGFHFQTSALRQRIQDILDGRNSADPQGQAPIGGFRLRIFSSGEKSHSAPTVPLAGELSFLEIGVDEASWNHRLKEGRRPYRIASVLIPALGAGMVLALITFYLSFRRERFLSKMKTDFVANVSHELKTPLALIRLFGETLSLGRLRETSKRQEYYDIITRESERLTHLIDNVLDFASIEADKKSYDRFPADLATIVRDTLKTYHYHLEAKGFSLEEDIEDHLPPCLADPNAIAQALINILNNAVKYSEHEKLISVRVWHADDTVRVAISDRGVGIPAEDLRKIFEGFYRSKATRRLGRRGSGLGLALVQHIVESHEGRVEVKSKPGEGSTFTLIFPCSDPDNMPKKGDRSESAEARGDRS